MMEVQFSKSFLHEIDKSKKYQKKHLESIEKIEHYLRSKNYLDDTSNRSIYIDGEYICDMSFFEEFEGMSSEKFLELVNRSIQKQI